MNYAVNKVSDEEMYFFDLRDYLVISGVLNQAEIGEFNAALDVKMDQARKFEAGRLAWNSKALKGDSRRIELTGMLGWEPKYRESFRKLLVNPYVVSRLNEFSGRGFRLDHFPLLISAKKGPKVSVCTVGANRSARRPGIISRMGRYTVEALQLRGSWRIVTRVMADSASYRGATRITNQHPERFVRMKTTWGSWNSP